MEAPSIREHNKKKQKRQHYWWLYHIKKALRARQNGYCLDCHQEKKTRLYRLKKTNDLPAVNDYLLLCSDCIAKKRADKEKRRREERSRRREEELKTKIWQRGPGEKGGSPESSKTNFFNQIRPLVFARDGAQCPYCGAKENLGLGVLLPLSRGGELSYDNYTVICQKCRGAKGGSQHRRTMTPLEFIWQREIFKYFLSGSLDHDVTVKNPGAIARLNVHLIGEIAEFCARVTADDRVPPEHRKKAEFIHIRLSESEEDKRRERKAERADVGSWIG